MKRLGWSAAVYVGYSVVMLVLDGVDVDTNARLARGAALGKFALLAVAHAYLVSAVVRRRS
ncbi:hypothetical protein [Mycolicibacter heraklionensis]|uniref:hypothetical protein n=1 Tax=Mycolicibacter heraklionensis TaxID=512402 RepID=UPI00103CDE25|nr:hypothetical protein [Mycolicibacter heraklionensis]